MVTFLGFSAFMPQGTPAGRLVLFPMLVLVLLLLPQDDLLQYAQHARNGDKSKPWNAAEKIVKLFK